LPSDERKAKKTTGARKEADDNFVIDFLKSREGRSVTSKVLRGVFDMLKKTS
jgi:hypothetical protein